MSTAYVALLLLGMTAVIGPVKLLLGLPLHTSIYLRRDTGIWTGIIALAHVVFGLQGHVGGKFWYYFIAPPDASYNFPLRIDIFGITSYLGLGATFILIMLLALSNNWSIKRIGAHRWKSLQRLSYAAIGMTLLHNIIFLVVWERDLIFVAMFSLVTLGIVTFQVLGYRQYKREPAK
jgi:sulfoxide reductase heme-binding subunit YedZ